MAAFASVADLESVLGREFDEDESAQVEALLDLASDAIRVECGQDITAGTSTVTLPGVWSWRLALPQRPVTAVDSVTVDGTPWASTMWSFTADGWLQRIGSALVDGDDPRQGAVSRVPLSWGGPTVTVEVTYDHGWSTPPAAAKQVCLDVVVRGLANPGNVVQEALGGYSITYGSETRGLVGLTRANRRTLRRAGLIRSFS